MLGRTLVALLASLALTGCVVGPDYHPPVLQTPATYAEAPRQAVAQDTAALAEWWQNFADAELTSLVQRAIAQNLDVQVAQARLREARATLRYTQASTQLPTVNAEATYTRSKTSTDHPQVPKLADSAGGTTLLPTTYSVYQAYFDASYELDLFGGVRRQVEASQAEAQSYEDSLRNTLVSVLAEVARDYVQLRQYQEQLAVATTTEATRQDTLKITQARSKAGLVGDADVANAAANLASTQASIPTIASNARQMMHAIAVLLGQNPGELLEALQTSRPIPAAPPTLPLGLPAELLRRRPDVRQAERSLAAATARIGIQVASLFPSITLTGQYGSQSGSALNLVAAAARYNSLGPQIKWGILNYPAIQANIRTYVAKRDQQFLTYQKTVLTAFQDVENALVAYSKEQERQTALAAEVEHCQKAADLAMLKYTRGLTNFLDVLDAQRSLATAQDALVQSKATVNINLISLYKALGGGWEQHDPVAQKENVLPAS
jgi:NodT family efflux transporter outer membrane factor (OMF) lipoprotein